MGLQTYAGTFAKTAGTGTQTISGVGFTPKAVLFWSVLSTAGDATFTGTRIWSCGYDLGTTARGQAIQADGGASPSIVASGTDIYSVIDRGFLKGRINAMTSDGFTFTWTLGGLGVETDGATIHYLALGGSTLQVSSVLVASSAATGSRSFTGAGFRPTALIAIGFGVAAASAFGWAASASLQCSLATVSCNAKNPSDCGTYQRATKFLTALGATDPTVVADEAALTSLDADGFTINVTTASGANSWEVLCLGGVEASAGALTQPTTTGSQAVSSLALNPKAVIFASAGRVISATPLSGVRMAFGATDGLHEHGVWNGDVDNVNPTQTGRYDNESTAISLATLPSTLNAQASVTSLDPAGGFTLQWTTVDATARQVLWLALGDPQAADPPAPGDTDPCAIVTPHYWAALQVQQGGGSTIYLGANRELRDDASYYGGYKAPSLLAMSPVTRVASDYKTGSWPAQSAELTWADVDYEKRTAMGIYRADFTGSELWFYLVSEAQRQALGTPRLLFYGRLYEDPLDQDLKYVTRANDLIGVSFSLLREEVQIPRRTVRPDDFPGLATANRGLGVPIIGGTVSNGTTGAIKLIDLGDYVCQDAVTRRALLVAGHACKSVIHLYQGAAATATVIPGGDYGTTAWAPGQTGWTSIVPSNASFLDINDNRYTLVFVSGARATSLDNGEFLYADVQGMETTGDGTGTLITGLLELYKHLMLNWFVGNYRAGAWLVSPTFEFYPGGSTVALIDDTSWDDAATLAATYLGGGFLGDFVIGANGRRRDIRSMLQDCNVSCNVSLGLNQDNQLFVKMLDRTRSTFVGSSTGSTAVRNILSSPRFTIAQNREWLGTEMAATYQRGYRDDGIDWDGLYELGRAPSEDRYGQIILNEGYGLIRDQSTAELVANQRMDFMAELPRIVTWKETLCGLRNEILSGFELTHYSGPSSVGYANRAMWLLKQIINPAESTVTLTAVDVENLLT